MSRDSTDSGSGRPNNHHNNRRDKRHKQLLAIARDILVTEGMNGLSIDKLAKLAEISRPTVYSHFRSKQVLLAGVAQQNLEVTRRLMRRAGSFKGTYRERAFGMVLAYEVMARFETEEFHMTEFFGMPWVRSKLPPEVAMAFAKAVTTYFDEVRGLVAAAVDAGELQLPGSVTVETVVFHSLTMSYGVYTSIIKERIILKLSAQEDPWAEARAALQRFWDGVGWRHRSDEVDYAAVAERFLKELFPDYWIQQAIDQLRKDEGLGEGDQADAKADGDQQPPAGEEDEGADWGGASAEDVD